MVDKASEDHERYDLRSAVARSTGEPDSDAVNTIVFGRLGDFLGRMRQLGSIDATEQPGDREA